MVSATTPGDTIVWVISFLIADARKAYSFWESHENWSPARIIARLRPLRNSIFCRMARVPDVRLVIVPPLEFEPEMTTDRDLFVDTVIRIRRESPQTAATNVSLIPSD
jgi:hypothetical protein